MDARVSLQVSVGEAVVDAENLILRMLLHKLYLIDCDSA